MSHLSMEILSSLKLAPGFPVISEESDELVFDDLRPFTGVRSLGRSSSEAVGDLNSIQPVFPSQVSDVPLLQHGGSRPQLSRSQTLPAIIVGDLSAEAAGYQTLSSGQRTPPSSDKTPPTSLMTPPTPQLAPPITPSTSLLLEQCGGSRSSLQGPKHGGQGLCRKQCFGPIGVYGDEWESGFLSPITSRSTRAHSLGDSRLQKQQQQQVSGAPLVPPRPAGAYRGAYTDPRPVSASRISGVPPLITTASRAEMGVDFCRLPPSSLSSPHSSLRRSSSIEKLPVPLPTTPSAPGVANSQTKPTSLLLVPSTGSRLLQDLSPSIRRRIYKDKQADWLQGSMEILVDGLNMSKSERKRLEKMNKINIHLHALYAAVEHDQLDKARKIIKTTDVNVNSINSDGFSLLDVAVMSDSLAMCRLLLSCRATESTQFGSMEERSGRLHELLRKAQRRVDTLTQYCSTGQQQVKQGQRQLQLWQRRLKLLNHLQHGLHLLKAPNAPAAVTSEVTGPSELRVTIQEPSDQKHAVSTKYRVQWSRCSDFAAVEGECTIQEQIPARPLAIKHLRRQQRYYVRAAAANCRGLGCFVSATPVSVVPSSWCDTSDPSSSSSATSTTCRLSAIDTTTPLDQLFTNICRSRPQNASDLRALDSDSGAPSSVVESSGGSGSQTASSPQGLRSARKGIKQLFLTSPRFQKHLKHGAYLATILYDEDRVATTTEDFLPVIEVDDTYPSTIHADYNWLLKVACTWSDVRSLRHDMERAMNLSAVHFRVKLLAAAEHMQNYLGVQNLGQLYYRPLRDSSGVLVLVSIAHLRCAKLPSTAVRWQSMQRMQRKLSTTCEELTVTEQLNTQLKQIVTYHMLCNSPVPPGLYLAAVSCHTSVEQIRVAVARDKPNLLPYVQVRDNPHVCREEWCWMLEQGESQTESAGVDTSSSPHPPAITTRSRFQHQLERAVRRLLHSMGDSANHDVTQYRLYNVELLQLGASVSLLLLVPPCDLVCSVSQSESSLTDSCLYLPLQTFEMVHLMAYRIKFISRYSRVSSILETDLIMAQHALREAFNDCETQQARSRVNQLQQFQTQLDQLWKKSRWLADTITWSRDRSQTGRSLPAACFRGWSSGDIGTSPIHLPISATSPGQKSAVASTLHQLKPPSSAPLPQPEFKRSSSQRQIKVRHEFQKSRTSECLLKPREGAENARILIDDSPSSSLILSATTCAATRPLLSGRDAANTTTSDNCFIGGAASSSDESLPIHHQQQQDGSPRLRRATMQPYLHTPPAASPRHLLSVHHLGSELRKCSAPELQVPPIGMGGASNSTSHAHWLSVSTPSFCVSAPGSGGGDDVIASTAAMTSSGPSLSSNSTETEVVSSNDEEQTGVLQVYAAYDCGLAGGTSVRLQVTHQTCAREVVTLVVQQLSREVIARRQALSPPLAPPTSPPLSEFCLVAVIGARERCMHDDFRPLQLQNPWRSGKLFVRRRSDVSDRAVNPILPGFPQ